MCNRFSVGLSTLCGSLHYLHHDFADKRSHLPWEKKAIPPQIKKGEMPPVLKSIQN